MTRRIITLTTDFGYDSSYVGALKGVIYSLYPDALLVDITHSIHPQNVLEGAFLLHTGYRDFPTGSLHLAVVDPGVGTNRRAICLQVPEVGLFVGPDNGLFSYLLDSHPGAIAREITNPAFMRHPISPTFHGRDIFAPTIARLANGEAFEEVGPLLDASALVRLTDLWPGQLMLKGLRGPYPILSGLSGRIVHIDHYGNLITNISRELFEEKRFSVESVQVEVERAYILQGIRQTYGYTQSGEVIALFGSNGFLEIAKVNGRADTYLVKPIEIGQTVRLRMTN